MGEVIVVLTWIIAFALVAALFAFWIVEYHNPKARKNMYRTYQNRHKSEKRSRNIMFFMIATVLAVVLLFVHAWADKRAAIEESFESYPWQQVYTANKDALSALRYGNMKNGSYVAIAENHEWISSIGNATQKEREALTSLFGFNEYGLEYNTIIGSVNRFVLRPI
jgi:uncharacterized membrane protein YsdA (DUF1294 family)